MTDPLQIDLDDPAYDEVEVDLSRYWTPPKGNHVPPHRGVAEINPFYRSKTKFVARKGERITCSAGHHVCDAVEDIPANGLTMAEMFGNWHPRVDPVQNGQPFTAVAPCFCGKPWLAPLVEEDRWCLCVEDEWR